MLSTMLVFVPAFFDLANPWNELAHYVSISYLASMPPAFAQDGLTAVFLTLRYLCDTMRLLRRSIDACILLSLSFVQFARHVVNGRRWYAEKAKDLPKRFE